MELLPRLLHRAVATSALCGAVAGASACFVDPGPPPGVESTSGGGTYGTSAGTGAGTRVTSAGSTGAGDTSATGSGGGAGTTGIAVDAGGPMPGTVVLDMVETACAAAWLSGAGPMPCPGPAMPDVEGAVVPMFDGSVEGPVPPEPLLAAAPDYEIPQGFAEGWYPQVPIPPGARFVARIGCVEAAVNCNFTWEVRAAVAPGGHVVLANGAQTLDGVVDVIEVPLDEFTGADLALGLYVDVGDGYSSHDVALWAGPRIVVGG